MLRTHPVQFDGVEHRYAVHDAVRGRAKALSENDDELRALFDVGQTLAYVEKNEPYKGAILHVPFAFETRDDYATAVTVLRDQSDEDLVWLGDALDTAGIDSGFDANRDYGRGGVREAVTRH